ncbi:MAG: peptidoglycan DD-metalloendopeptidase family protein, partial [Thermoleophilia bacterium]|nr:peptidoglycan DD-metalloendopeptidase family protein [Thermoleophilia bacterium]
DAQGNTALFGNTTGSLAPGAGGADVKALQRKLRVRGIRVPVDGSYGRQTRAGVRILQRKLRLPVTGIADATLLSKLGLKIRAVASAPVATPAAPAAAQYLKAFPVAGTYSFANDFGAARSQGSHQGNDVMSPRGTPVVAVADGTIKRLTRVETGLGGVWIYLVDAAGNEYYYAHLNDIVAGLDAGSKVTAGQQIGTVGNTGDARWGAPHLHFEVHPGGGGAINPYADLVALDPNRGKN